MTNSLSARLVSIAAPATTVLMLVASTTGCRVDFDGEGFGHGSGDRYQESFHFTYKVNASPRLTVDNENGEIEIASWDRAEIDITGTKYASTESLLHEIKIDSNASPDQVTVRTLRHQAMHGSSGARYTIRVPKQTTLDRIHSTNGGIRADNLAAPVTLESTNGSLHFSRIEGRLEGRTTNGGIELADCRGDARLHTSNGKITGDLAKGSLDAKTSNGSVRLSLSQLEGKGPIRIATSNGAIDLTLDAGHDLRAESSNSSITVKLPPNANADVRARTRHGKATSAFGGTTSHRGGGEDDDRDDGRSRGNLDTRIGTGGPLLELTTTNGSIHIEKR